MNIAKNHRLNLINYMLLTVALILLALIVLVQANPGTRLPGRDYGFYVYIGDQILHDKLPYRDAWESKPPAIFYLNALALWIGRGSRWGIWLFELFSLLGACVIYYITVQRLWGQLPALGSMVLWLAGFNLSLQGGNLTEEYPLFLHFLSIACFVKLQEEPGHRLSNVLLGLAFGISFLFRPNNAVVEAAILLTLLLVHITRRHWWILFTQTLLIGTSALLPILLTGLYFMQQGIFYEFMEASFLYNFTYSATAITSTSPLLAGFQIYGWIAWIAAAGYLIALYYAIKTKQPIYCLLLIGAPLAITTSDLAQRNYAHYFMNWLPFLGLLCGLAIYFLTQHLPAPIRPFLSRERVFLGITIPLALAFFIASGSASEYGKAIQRFVRRDAIGVEIRTRTAMYVENHTDPSDLVLFWAASPGENFMSNRESPSAYLFYPLYVHSEISKKMSSHFLQDMLNRRPILIVDVGDHEALSLNPEERARQIADGFAWEYPPDNLAAFFQFVEENYYLDAKVGKKTIYRLRQP